MFDIFTKSKVESGFVAPGLSPVRPSRLDGAWRVYRAIDRALKTMEAERKILAGRIEDVSDSGTVSLAGGNSDVEAVSRDGFDLNRLDERIREGTDRASRLDRDIAFYKLLKTSLLAGFPELGPNDVRPPEAAKR